MRISDNGYWLQDNNKNDGHVYIDDLAINRSKHIEPIEKKTKIKVYYKNKKFKIYYNNKQLMFDKEEVKV